MFRLPSIPFDPSAVSDWLSHETIEFHHGKHHRAYVEKLNELLPGSGLEGEHLEDIICQASGSLFNNAAQAWNHTFYWLGIEASRKEDDPFVGAPELKAAIENSFESIESFIDQFKKTANEVFGSGWVWLVKDSEDRLKIVETKDACNPITTGMRPLLTCDVWEHAYYIDHRNERAEYLDGFMKSVNWSWVNQQLLQSDAHEISTLMLEPGRNAPIASTGLKRESQPPNEGQFALGSD